jgi:hypothetical protein
MDTSHTLGQLTFPFFRFWIMDDYIDWSTFPADTMHLPLVVSFYETGVVHYYHFCKMTKKSNPVLSGFSIQDADTISDKWIKF